jgi:hypothetical protein
VRKTQCPVLPISQVQRRVTLLVMASREQVSHSVNPSITSTEPNHSTILTQSSTQYCTLEYHTCPIATLSKHHLSSFIRQTSSDVVNSHWLPVPPNIYFCYSFLILTMKAQICFTAWALQSPPRQPDPGVGGFS